MLGAIWLAMLVGLASLVGLAALLLVPAALLSRFLRLMQTPSPVVARAVPDDQTGTLGGFLGPPATTPLGKAQLRPRDQTGTLGGFLGPPATTPLGKAQLRHAIRQEPWEGSLDLPRRLRWAKPSSVTRRPPRGPVW